jgi:hypothetical protein
MATSSTATISQNLSTRQTKFTHPTFVTLSPIWNQLKDVREGTGGFIDGTYLVAHPREWLDATAATPTQPTKKLKARRTLASYENFAATIIDALKTALFREQPIRRVGDETKQATDAPPTPLEDWWENVDGAGTHLDDFMAAAWDIAGTFGHVHLYLDLPTKTPVDEGSVETAADQVMPFLRVYTPLDAWDWMVDDLGALTAIKFAEIAPRQSLDTAWRPEVRVRMVDETSWRLYDQKGALVQQGEHQMGRLPVVTLFAKRRPMHPQIGASVLGDPKLYVDLYNLVSEIRELLRNQTFGILNVPLGAGENSMTLEDAKSMMTNSSGTENVLFSGAAANFIQPSAENVVVYHAEFERKLRVIYRLVALAWEADSKDAEAEGSLKLKREDMNQRLSGYADELEAADYLLAELFYRSQYGEQGVERLEKDEVQIKYPDTFDMTPFAEVLEQAEAAMSLGMPPLFLKELRKRLARKFDGMADLPTPIMDEIDKQIDSAADDLTPAEKQQNELQMQQDALKAAGKPTLPKPGQVAA